MQHILQSNPPRVFTMQLAWQTNNEASEDITQAMNGMTEVTSTVSLIIYWRDAHIITCTLLHYSLRIWL